MKFSDAIDAYVRDMRHDGRINSDRTEVGYRQVLDHHANDVANRDPRTTNREDVKRTLARWQHPNTVAQRRAVLVSFYRWTMEEGLRRDNPAEQTRRPRKRPAVTTRLTREEAGRLLSSTRNTRERRAVYLGVCAGLRSHELRNVRGEHFRRVGYVYVSPDIGKGGRERWVPVIAELELVVAEIRAHVAEREYCNPASRGGGWGPNTFWREDPTAPMSSQVLQRIVRRVAAHAGIVGHCSPHTMRHAFADHIARQTGLMVAQAMLGHADVSTTQLYVGATTLEELAAAVRDLRFTDPAPPPPSTGRNRASGEGGIRTLDRLPANPGAENEGDEP